MTCITSQLMMGKTSNNCFDWNKAYWAVLPILMMIITIIVFYYMFWYSSHTALHKKT